MIPAARLLHCIVLACACGGALAQAYPNRPIRILVGFTPGGTTDVIARIVAQKMSEGLGLSVVIDNRPGAGANIAAELAAKETADGGAGSARLGAWMRPGSGL